MSKVNTSIPVSTGQRSDRDLSAVSLGTTDFGRLDVLYHTEINPSEDITIDWQGILKGATMPAPTRARMYYDVRAFFVPYRVLTAHPEQGKTNFIWDYFIEKLSNTSHPYSTLNDIANCICYPAYALSSDPRIIADARRLLSQLRLPDALVNSYNLGSGPNIEGTPFGSTPVNLWPFMSYQRVWWDFYRDKSLIDESLLSQYIPLPSPGRINAAVGSLQKYLTPRYACWPKDYFTNARSQVGTFGSSVSFTRNQVSGQDISSNNVNPLNIPTDTVQNIALNGDLVDHAGQDSTGAPNGAALSYAAIRMARLVDNYLQRLNIAGTSLINRIFARFGVRPSDQIVWSSQYVGGQRYDFTVGDILSNIETGSVEPQSVDNAFNYGAAGSQSGQSTGSIYSRFESDHTLHFHSGRDYGHLLIIGSLVPYTGYFQGLHRSWVHGTNSSINDARAQYLTPEFSNAGLQPILKQEIFGNSATSSASWLEIFGFGERYGEYAYQPPVIDGDLVLSSTKTGMLALHLFREFSSMPSLTASFTQIDPAARESLDRIFNYLKTGSQDETLLDHFERYFSFNVHCPNRALASSMLPDLFEDNNHGDVISVPVGGTRF